MKSRWSDGFDPRPKLAELIPGPVYYRSVNGAAPGHGIAHNMVRRPAPNTPVELSADEVPERCEKLLLQLSVGFSNADSKLQETDHHVSGCLSKLATLLRPQ